MVAEPQIVNPELENLLLLAEEFYERRAKLEHQITLLRCEQANVGLLYDQVVAKARDLELDASEKNPI
jgi:hypothetical protein